MFLVRIGIKRQFAEDLVVGNKAAAISSAEPSHHQMWALGETDMNAGRLSWVFALALGSSLPCILPALESDRHCLLETF